MYNYVWKEKAKTLVKFKISYILSVLRSPNKGLNVPVGRIFRQQTLKQLVSPAVKCEHNVEFHQICNMDCLSLRPSFNPRIFPLPSSGACVCLGHTYVLQRTWVSHSLHFSSFSSYSMSSILSHAFILSNMQFLGTRFSKIQSAFFMMDYLEF